MKSVDLESISPGIEFSRTLADSGTIDLLLIDLVLIVLPIYPGCAWMSTLIELVAGTVRQQAGNKLQVPRRLRVYLDSWCSRQ